MAPTGPRGYGPKWRNKTQGSTQGELSWSRPDPEAERRKNRPSLATHPLLDRPPSRARPRHQEYA